MLLVLFKFHESQQKQHWVCRWRHLYLLQIYFLFLTDVFTFSSWYLVPKIKPNFDPQFQNSTWNSQSRKYFFCSDLKGKDVVGMKKMLYKECAAWIACRQLLPAIALAAALAWLPAIASWIHPLYLRLVTLAFTIKALKIATNSRQLPFLNPHCFDLTRFSFKIEVDALFF